MKLIAGMAILIAILISAIFLINRPKDDNKLVANTPKSSPAAPVFAPFTAKFEIYTLGTKRIFADKKYHYQSNKVYLEEIDSNIIHIAEPVITWQNFFDTLPAPMKVTAECLTTGTDQRFCSGTNGKLEFVLNGIIGNDILDQVIRPEDELIIRYSK